MGRRIVFCMLFMIAGLTEGWAQFMYGTTGLLHMPTAEMQRDKTFMMGISHLDKMATPSHWYYDTWNYYVNITFFPWLEVGYTCTLHSAESLGLDKDAYPKFTNQDRSFHGRLRLWKEGWWKEWTPQIVVGVNDFTTGGSEDYMDMAVKGKGNGYLNRYYLAATKHVSWYGKWGIHMAYLYNRREDDKLNGPAFGVDYCFDLKGDEFWLKAVNNLNLMAEYDSKSVNVGAKYSVWKEHINLVGELRKGKYPSVGLFFKIYLK